MKYSIITLLICALLTSSIVRADEQSPLNTIKLGLFKDANTHWIAITVKDGSLDTTAVQMRDSAAGAEWAAMQLVDGWDHWVINSPAEFTFPLSFRLTSKAEEEKVLENIISELGEQDVDTGVQYAPPRVEARRKSSHGRKTTQAPRPQPSKTTSAPTRNPSTKAPVQSTKAPAQTTKAPAQTTKAPAPTNAPSGNGKMGLLVPLYTYPGATWDTVAASAGTVKTVAIINPNSGPGNGPDANYKTYMKKLQSAGVELIGYVHTSYGARSIADVKADINKYASEFPQVTGIFIDEAAATANQVSYYTQVHQYIMSMPGYKYNVLNPGAVPTQAYYAISTQIVSFEDVVSKFSASANPSFASASNKDHFSVISYAANSAQMQTAVTAAKSKGYYGWVYFTDGSGASTYNTLPSYYAAMASAVAKA